MLSLWGRCPIGQRGMKVLIITYYWPPAGGPGVQRWLKFVKYLPQFGVQPVVYCPENPNYPLVDDNLIKEVSGDVEIIKQPIFEPYQWASIFSKKQTKTIASGIINAKKQSFIEKMLLYIRGNFFIPDARKFWVKPSVNYLEKYIKEHQINTIITTGPPHSVHLIGLQLQQQLNLKWIADFRDPWTTIGYHQKLKLTATSAKKHKQLEQQVLQSATEIIVTSPTTKSEFQQITKQPITVITNGFDDVKVDKVVLDNKFTIAHIGSLLSGRDPKILWEVLAELITENSDFASDFELKLIGAVSDEVLESITTAGLQHNLNVVGYVSHQEAQLAQRQAQILLLIEIDSEITKCIIPGKVFEYLQSNRPILGFGPENADFKSIITQTNTGKVFGYDASEKVFLKQTILSWYKNYQDKNLQVFGMGIQNYHRKRLTRFLADILLKE